MNIADLTPTEFAVVEWQYRMCGDFMSALWEAISRADDGNLYRLRQGFPNEVDGYLAYTREDGWWQRVQDKANTPEAA